MIAEEEAPAPARRLPELALIAVTLFWGFTFITVQYGLGHSGPFFLVALRFAAAAGALALLGLGTLGRITGVEWRAGLLTGAGMVACYAFQTIGLQSISSSKSAFITAVYVPLVPLIELAVFRRMPARAVWLGIALAFLGLILLAGPAEVRSVTLGYGEVMTILAALATAVQIVQVSRFANRVDARRVSIVQTGTCALLCLALVPLVGETVPPFSGALAAVTLGLGVGSALVQLAMNWAQRSVAASRAALIYAGEPVYAGIIGRVAGERMGPVALVGGALVILSVVVSELRWPARPRAPHTA